MTSRLTALLLALSLTSALAAEKVPANHSAQMKAGLELFSTTIRPALNDHCLKCHGGEKIRGGFNLSSRETMLEGGESGMTVDLASPEESLLMVLLRHEEEPTMPPKKPKLDDALLDDFERWIKLGAPFDKPLIEGTGASEALVVNDNDRDFWSFRPLSEEAPPEISDPWIQTEIDHFILAKQQEVGLTPNPILDKRTLARRAYLDLLGLPPSPEEMEAFLADQSSQAWPNLIDRLLESPHYGERQARYWMDVARFAESFGFEQNYDRPSAYHYRDFLIQAFNADMPWDQMASWQVAGDELAPDDRLAWMATGFLVAGVFPTQITEAEFEHARYDELDDMVGTTSTAFLGLSVGCARCHDHKFDPIPVSDYYEMAATFTTAIRSERTMEFHPEIYEEKMKPWRQKRDELQSELKRSEESTLNPGFTAWLENPTGLDKLASKESWAVLEPDKVTSKGGASFSQQTDGSWLAKGKSPKFDEYTIEAKAPAGSAALRIEALTHKSLPRNGPGRAGNGNFALGNLTVLAKSGSAKPVAVKLTSARATHEQNPSNLSVQSSIDGDPNKTGWAVDKGGIGKDQAAIFAFEEPLAKDSELTITLRFHLNNQHTFGRFRLSVSDDPSTAFEVGKSGPMHLASAAAALNVGANELTTAQHDALRSWFASQDADWSTRNAALKKHLAAEPKRDMKAVMVCSEGVPPMKNHADGRGYPHFYPEVHHLTRGDPKQKGEVAQQGFLQVLMPDKEANANWIRPQPEATKTSHRRASFADWMTDTQSGAGHLLARVIVNRIWQQHFGRGIVATPNDFGFQGSRPTHPTLLDWLARDLIKSGWKLKHLHKKIMLSATYQQTTDFDPADSAKDLDNNFLWRFEPRRLEAEPIRDSLLAVSGMLDRTQFGPGSKSEAMKRRSIYFTIKRSQLPNVMLIFDWPEHLVSIGKRPNTTVAPQALYLMNNPQVRSYAEALAKRANGSIEAIYELALSRPPTQAERNAAAGFLTKQGSKYSDQNAALADFCQALMASNEFLYLP